jgi:hypothetical protein
MFCTNDLCTACYYDSVATNDNYCTACIANASLTDGSIGDCSCNTGYYYESSTNTCP